MPRPPAIASATTPIADAVFSPVAHRASEIVGPVFPLHVGDTWMEPFVGGRMEDLKVSEHPGIHRYADTQGIPELIDALVEKLRDRNELAVERGSLLVTAGATAGLAAAVGSLVDPGDEVLILAPFWPLIRGIVQTFRGVPIEVPFYDRVDSPETAVEAVRRLLTSRSVALYVSSPSNPTGRVLPRAWLEALAELARSAGLWLISDEVYEDYVYQGEHTSIAAAVPERALTVFSFSKAYGMAGNRLGYLVGPRTVIAATQKISTHTSYCAPRASQLAGLAALRGGAEWVSRAREQYRAAGKTAADLLGLPAPEGSTFLFVDVGDVLDSRGLSGFLEDCLHVGVVVAPGASSGHDYAEWIRLCYTAAPPEQIEEAVRRLAHRLGRHLDRAPGRNA